MDVNKIEELLDGDSVAIVLVKNADGTVGFDLLPSPDSTFKVIEVVHHTMTGMKQFAQFTTESGGVGP